MHQIDARQQMHQEHASPAPTSTIIVHGSSLEPMSSRVISQLIRLLISARRQQQRLLVWGLSEHQRYIFEITRLCQYIEIAASETQAVAAASTTQRGTVMLIGETAL